MDKVVMLVAAVATFAAVVSAVWWLFYFLWNSVAAGVFGLPEMTFWQSVGALLLLSLLGNMLRTALNKG